MSASGIGSSATGISFSGLISGVDTQSIVQKMVQFESRPIALMDNQIADISQKQGSWTAISSAVKSFLSAAQAVGDASYWNAVSSNTSDGAIATVGASAGAVQGTYVIKGNRPGGNPMAMVEQVVSHEFTDSGAALGVTGRARLGIGTSTGTGSGYIDLVATDTLKSVADKINGAQLGISAAVIQTGTNLYRLQLSGSKTGDANRIYFNDNGTGLFAGAAGLDIVSSGAVDQVASAPGRLVQAAQDAKFTVNGLAFTASTNEITTAIPNSTVKLVNLTDSNSVTITNSPDKGVIQNKVKGIVDAFNSLASTVKKLTGKGGALQGNATATSLMNTLAKDLTSTFPGLPSTMNSLSQAGIKITKDGTLEFDTTIFQKAVTDNPTGLKNLFTDSTNGFINVVSSQIKPFTDKKGIFDQFDDSFTKQVKQLTDRQDAFKKRMEVRQKSLVQQFTNMEQAIARLRQQGDSLTKALGSLEASKK